MLLLASRLLIWRQARSSWISEALVVPSTAERLEDIDLKLNQAGIGGSDRRVQGHEGLVRGEQVEVAHGPGHVLVMRDVERAMDLGLRISECLPTVQSCAVFSERLLGFFERREHHGIKGRQSRGFG